MPVCASTCSGPYAIDVVHTVTRADLESVIRQDHSRETIELVKLILARLRFPYDKELQRQIVKCVIEGGIQQEELSNLLQKDDQMGDSSPYCPPEFVRGEAISLSYYLLKYVFLLDDRQIVEVLLSLSARESIGSTGIGHGFALPHTATDRLTETRICFTRTGEDLPLHMDSLDGDPVHFFFLMLCLHDRPGDRMRGLERSSFVKTYMIQNSDYSSHALINAVEVCFKPDTPFLVTPL